MFSTLNYLAYLEDIGTPVINGRQAFSYEISKARQITLASELGIRHPRARVITHPGKAVETADGRALERDEVLDLVSRIEEVFK